MTVEGSRVRLERELKVGSTLCRVEYSRYDIDQELEGLDRSESVPCTTVTT